MLPPQRRPSEDESILINHPEETKVAGLERFHARRVRLRNVASGVDLIIESDHLPLSFGLRIDADPHRVQQISGPVKILFRGVSLSTDQNHGFLGVDREVKPPSGFLQRIRAVGNDHSSHFRSFEVLSSSCSGMKAMRLTPVTPARETVMLLRPGMNLANRSAPGPIFRNIASV